MRIMSFLVLLAGLLVTGDLVAQKGKEVLEMREDDRVVLLTIPWEMVRPESD